MEGRFESGFCVLLSSFIISEGNVTIHTYTERIGICECVSVLISADYKMDAFNLKEAPLDAAETKYTRTLFSLGMYFVAFNPISVLDTKSSLSSFILILPSASNG